MKDLDQWVSPALILLILFCSGFGFDSFGVPEPIWASVFSIVGFGWCGFRWMKNRIRRNTGRVWKYYFIGCAVLLLYITLYVLNPAYEWLEGGLPKPIDYVALLPATRFLDGTVQALGTGALVLALFGLAMSLERKPARVVRSVIIGAAAVTAMVMLGQRAAPQQTFNYDWTSFFTYENHYAAWVNMIIPVGLFFAVRQRIKVVQSGFVSGPDGLIIWAVGLLLASIMVSGSRAGLVIAAATVLVFILWMVRFYRYAPFIMPAASGLTKAGLVIGSVVTAAIVAFGVIREWGSFKQVGQQLAFRGQIVRDTLMLFCDKPIYGMGPGSYSEIFPFVQTLAKDIHVPHAHCDPVEFLAEFGIVGTLLCAGFFVLIFIKRPTREGEETAGTALRRLERAGLLTALVGVCLHSLVDFPFHNPSILFLAAVWAGMIAGRPHRKLGSKRG